MSITYSVPPQLPEEKLANMMRNDLGVEVDSKHLRLFINANWRAVQAYAHAIHEAHVAREPILDEPRKAPEHG